jgi:alkanesulfonate monooxygenase SsuD/methylene tetrahydromethanopterin reductase-like flavin-dependent oxidoreductase (luciferase family)
MRVFHMTEQPYFPAWEGDRQLRVNIPNSFCDPKIAADLYHRYYDEWLLADDLGLDIMINEHHATATCMSSAAVIPLAILARETKKARLLVLGYPLGNRPDPLKAAEELATIDVLSRGRLEMGFVKGVPYELPVSNLNPTKLGERFWESHDFIMKALTSHGEPFNWEGEFFHYRHVNVWPRAYQDPHPPVWITTASKGNAREIAARGYVMATMGTGYASKATYDAYKQQRREMGEAESAPDRFAYLGLVAVGSTETEARRRAEFLAEYPRSSKRVHGPFANPPGFLSVDDNVRLLKAGSGRLGRLATKDGRTISSSKGSVQDLMDAGMLFCGTPDQVYNQITEFSDAIGGFGNLLAMMQAGYMSHDDTVDNMTLFATEVLPRLQEYKYALRQAPAVAAE